jgi:putative redox protein
MATTETVLHHLVDKRFVGVTPDGLRVLIDGEASHRIGMGPMQLVLNALAGCAAYDVVEMLRKRKLPIRGYRIEAAGERADGTPSPFVRVHTRHVFDVPGLDQKTAERFVDLALTKYCSVASSLRAELAFEVIVEASEAAPGGASSGPVGEPAEETTAAPPANASVSPAE